MPGSSRRRYFGPIPTQANRFGRSSQPALGSNVFGTANQPAFGASSTPNGGSTSASPNIVFGSFANPYTAQSSSFSASSTPTFVSTPAFDVSSTPTFSFPSYPIHGVSTSASPNIVFGRVTNPYTAQSSSFSASSVSSTPAFSFHPSPVNGGSTSATPNIVFGSFANLYTAQSSSFSASSTPTFVSTPAFDVLSTPTFSFPPSFVNGNSPFRPHSSAFATSYASTPIQEATVAKLGRSTRFASTRVQEKFNNRVIVVKLRSISAMAAYNDKSHEELRWEDYQLGDKGGRFTQSSDDEEVKRVVYEEVKIPRQMP